MLRLDGLVSPDGNWLAHHDKDDRLWLFNTKTKQEKLIAQSMNGDFGDLHWSPDSKWLAFVESANNQFSEIKVFNVDSSETKEITSDRYDSVSPTWSSDGKWLYFLSDRLLKTTVESPWGSRQPDPFFDHQVKIYQLALVPDLRSPFLPPDELHPDGANKPDEKKSDERKAKKNKRTTSRATRQNRWMQRRNPATKRKKRRKTKRAFRKSRSTSMTWRSGSARSPRLRATMAIFRPPRNASLGQRP